MATKRKTDNESPRQPRRQESPAVTAAPADEPVSGGGSDEKSVSRDQSEQAAKAADAEAADPKAEAGKAKAAQAEPERAAEPSPSDRRAEELASQLEEANSRHLRMAADFENYKKRIRQEQVDTMRYAASTVAERLLPVLDDAKLAVSHAPESVDESWLKGVKLTFQKLEEVLASVGVERIEALGIKFDPKQHEAVGSEETSKHPEDTVVAELRAGYRMHDRVLRPALVKVARPPA